jgi:hypothetical protein
MYECVMVQVGSNNNREKIWYGVGKLKLIIFFDFVFYKQSQLQPLYSKICKKEGFKYIYIYIYTYIITWPAKNPKQKLVRTKDAKKTARFPLGISCYLSFPCRECVQILSNSDWNSTARCNPEKIRVLCEIEVRNANRNMLQHEWSLERCSKH